MSDALTKSTRTDFKRTDFNRPGLSRLFSAPRGRALGLRNLLSLGVRNLLSLGLRNLLSFRKGAPAFGAFALALTLGCSGVLPSAEDGGESLVDNDGDGGNTLGRDGGSEPEDACFGAAPTNEDTLVQTTEGLVRGQPAVGATVFLGLPYAAPPQGERRFKPPAPMTCWEGERPATAFGPRCPQTNFSGQPTGEEDCLHLNLWTPVALSGFDIDNDIPRPVLFWIHGGANVIGGSEEPTPGGNLFDGENFAREQDVVLVSLNYRLGALGFLAHQSLVDEDASENTPGASGNYGLRDQQQALEWVQRNIAAFGGDPGRVTIFGESAGAVNVCALVASPLSEALFSGAIMQSGDCHAASFETRHAEADDIILALGCAAADDIPACLRSVTMTQILDASGDLEPVLGTWDLPFGPAVDGRVLLDFPLSVLEAGSQQVVPLLIGSNAHESELFLPNTIATCFDFDFWVESIFGSVAEDVKDQYDCWSYPLARYALVDVLTDVGFTCRARRIARASAQSGVPTWRYHYRYQRADPQLAFFRAGHAMELAILFGTYARPGYFPPASEDALSGRMMSAWRDLAKDGALSEVAGTTWAPYAAADDNFLIFDDAISTEAGLASTRCDFWDLAWP